MVFPDCPACAGRANGALVTRERPGRTGGCRELTRMGTNRQGQSVQRGTSLPKARRRRPRQATPKGSHPGRERLMEVPLSTLSREVTPGIPFPHQGPQERGSPRNLAPRESDQEKSARLGISRVSAEPRNRPSDSRARGIVPHGVLRLAAKHARPGTLVPSVSVPAVGKQPKKAPLQSRNAKLPQGSAHGLCLLENRPGPTQGGPTLAEVPEGPHAPAREEPGPQEGIGVPRGGLGVREGLQKPLARRHLEPAHSTGNLHR